MRLRAATRTAHDRLDLSLGVLDLGDEADLDRFLSGHRRALSAAAPAVRTLLPAVDGVIVALDADLAALGTRGAAARPLPAPSADALGLAYVISGAHLGNAVLHRRWASSARGRAANAGRFLADRAMRSAWPGIVAAIEARHSASGFDSLTAGARAGFALYRAAFGLDDMENGGGRGIVEH